MKFITRVIIGSVFAFGSFLAMLLFAKSSLNISLLTGLGAFIFAMILFSSTFDKILKADDERNREKRERNREIEEIQARTRAEETGRLQARTDFKEGDKRRKDPYGIHAAANRLRKGKRGI